MKKTFKRIVSLLLTLGVVMSFSVMAFAENTVTFNEDKTFVFDSDSKYENNLFQNFSDVLPGDKIKDTITISNTSNENIKVYLRSLGADEKSKEMLSFMTLKVADSNGNVISKNTLDKTGNIGEWKYLGKLKKNKTTTLYLTLTVSPLMDNEYMNKLGGLKWEFKADEIVKKETVSKPEKVTSEPKKSAPKTGEGNTLYIMLIALISAIFVGGVCIAVSIKKNKK